MALRPKMKRIARSARPVMGKPVRTRKVRKRFRGTFLHADDEGMPHNDTFEVAHDLRLKKVSAYDPSEAKWQIDKRVHAIRKLWRIKRIQLSRTKDPKKKAYLQKQMKNLDAMEKAPFDIVVTDINMPRGHPTGVEFVGYLKRNYPNQKILVHSDDSYNIEQLAKEYGVPYVHKLDGNPVEDLKDELRRELKLGPIKKPKGKPKFIRATIRGP